MSKASDIAYEMAKYIAAELPIPDHLYDDIMKEVCAEEVQKRKGSKPSADKKDVEGV